LRAGASLLLAGAFGLSLVDCGPRMTGTSQPPWLGQPVPATSAPPPPGKVDAAAAAIADPNAPVFDPKSVEPLLDDPRLAEVKAQVAREAPLAAANRLGEIMQKTPPSAAELPRWEYQLARLRLVGGDPLAAVRAFDRAAAADWPLASYARLMAADLLIKTDQPGEGLARLAGIPTGDATLDDEVLLLTAAAHASNHDVDKAATIWDPYLARRPRPSGWHNVALRYVKALLNQPSSDRAEKAVTVARQVIYDAPNARAVAEATELEEQALATVPNARRNALSTVSELALRARGLAEGRQAQSALAQADKVIKMMEEESSGGGLEATCDPYLARGKALEQLKRISEASDAFGVAGKRCQPDDKKAAALLSGCRTALKSGQPSTARHRCAELEKELPSHRFADDARLFGAQAAKNLGDIATFTRMLLPIGDDYPNGDVVDEALFTLAFDRIDAGDWAAAVAPLERAVKIKKRGRPYSAEGRPQYYLARAKLETGAADALEELEGVIRDFPLSYYMVHAYARLASVDPARAKKAVEEGMAGEPAGDFVIADHPELHQPGFERAVELTRQGDSERALVELERLGVRDSKAHPSLLWASAFLLSQIDAPVESHGVLRSSGLWREHWPAGVWRHVWEVAYPRPFLPIVQKELGRSPIPEHLAFAVMREESAFKHAVVSHANAYGLMQLILPTAKSVAPSLKVKATKETLKQPEINIALGCRFLSNLTRRFDYNPVLSIPGYNAGPGAPEKWLGQRPAEPFDIWIEKIPYDETREYTKRVIQSMAAYAMLYGQGMEGALLVMPLDAQPPPADVPEEEAAPEAD
jgi:soluble lytic murein transglycosylase